MQILSIIVYSCIIFLVHHRPCGKSLVFVIIIGPPSLLSGFSEYNNWCVGAKNVWMIDTFKVWWNAENLNDICHEFDALLRHAIRENFPWCHEVLILKEHLLIWILNIIHAYPAEQQTHIFIFIMNTSILFLQLGQRWWLKASKYSNSRFSQGQFPEIRMD